MSTPGNNSNDINNVNVQTNTGTATVVAQDVDITTAAKTLYGKLLNGDSEPGEFVDQDRDITHLRFDKVFFRDSAMEDIYDAIARKGGISNNTTAPKASTFIQIQIINYCLSIFTVL